MRFFRCLVGGMALTVELAPSARASLMTSEQARQTAQDQAEEWQSRWQAVQRERKRGP
jgi:hypothetical protein